MILVAILCAVGVVTAAVVTKDPSKDPAVATGLMRRESPDGPPLLDRLPRVTVPVAPHKLTGDAAPDAPHELTEMYGKPDKHQNQHFDTDRVAGEAPLGGVAGEALPSAAAVDPFIGLPIAPGPRPPWLAKDDGLVIDARSKPESGGGILILQAVFMDASGVWGKKQGFRPRWLRAILSTNREHARRHGHALVLRAKPTQPQLTSWQTKRCGKKSKDQCTRDNERENYNWEKHLMLADYLLSPQAFTHVLMLDADAAFIQPQHNTLQDIAGMLDRKQKDLFLTDEDWLKYDEGRINCGLVMARNSKFTQALFQDTFDAHVMGPTPLKNWRIGVKNVVCSSNEQICLNDLWRGGRGPIFSDHAMMAGGKR